MGTGFCRLRLQGLGPESPGPSQTRSSASLWTERKDRQLGESVLLQLISLMYI